MEERTPLPYEMRSLGYPGIDTRGTTQRDQGAAGAVAHRKP